jgi:hypothetical protein
MNQLIIINCKDSAVKPTHAACPSCSWLVACTVDPFFQPAKRVGRLVGSRKSAWMLVQVQRRSSITITNQLSKWNETMRLCQFSSSLVLVCSSILNITCKGVLTEHHSSCITSWAPHRLPSQSPCRTGAWTLDTADSFHRSTRVKVSGSEESVGFFHGNPFALV